MGGHRANQLRAGARRLNRVRWGAKLKNVRHAGSGGSASRLDKLSYVLWSPELGDLSFDMADPAATAAFLAEALSVPARDALAALEEVIEDRQLREDYARLRKPSLLPRHLALSARGPWWVTTRLCKPKLVVETGVWYGLGSAMLLRALELNAQEGYEGRLISFDPDTTGGWLVPERLKPLWTWVQATTDDALESSLQGQQVDFFIHDTPSDYARERGEFEAARRHAAPGGVLLSSNGENTPALRELCAEHGMPYHHYPYAARRHFYVTRGLSLTVVPRS
jgi:methyltransferase family protein